MRWFAAFAIFLSLAACSSGPSPAPSGSNAPPPAANALSSADNTSPNGDVPAPPEGYNFTLLCRTFSGDSHIADATRIKQALIQKTGSREWYVVHSDQESNLYYGFYRTYDDRTQVGEYARAQNDRANIAAMLDENGDRLFDIVMFQPVNLPDPQAPKEWDVVNSKGYWSLRIAIYSGNPLRKQYAVNAVKQARLGIEAYYHHGDSASEVFIGSWPRNAVKEGESASANASNPNQPLIVLSGPIGAAESPDVQDALRHHYKIMAPQIVPIDPTLKAAMAQYPYTYINGELRGKRISAAGGTVIPFPSFLVEIRPDDDSEAKSDENQIPVNSDTSTGSTNTNGDNVPATPGAGGYAITPWPMRLLIASTNPGKIREFRQMLGGTIDVTDLTEHRELPPVEETGNTFHANACLKATSYAKSLDAWALADDSGLAVDALSGRPGVHSARWAALNNAGGGDADNNALLVRQLRDIPDEDRTARFICGASALADPKGRIFLTASDSVEGRILRDPRGQGGFGYDPLFLIDELGRTTGELPPEEKHKISHRGKALRRMHGLMLRAGLIAAT